MRLNSCLWVYLLIAAALVLACGGASEKPKAAAGTPAGILELVDIADIVKTSQVETYVGESLYEYINGGAELFHQYDFVEVSTADFKSDEQEIVADIYQFSSSNNAYGLYSMIRPESIEIIKIGVQGFASETSFDFVKDKFIVRLVCYDGTPEALEVMRKLATQIESVISGVSELPVMFGLFPLENRVENSEKIVAEAYLGQAGLDDVYTVDYIFDTETVQMFISADDDGAKFNILAESSVISADDMKSVKDLPFNTGKVVVLEDPYSGKILAGLKDDKLAGVVGYAEQIKPVVNDWLLQ